jgi:hypothetical protein
MCTSWNHNSRQPDDAAGESRRYVAEDGVTHAEDNESYGNETTIVPAAAPTEPLASREPMVSHWRLPTFYEPEPGVTAADLFDIADATRQAGNAMEPFIGTENRTVRDTLPSPPPSLEDLAS